MGHNPIVALFYSIAQNRLFALLARPKLVWSTSLE